MATIEAVRSLLGQLSLSDRDKSIAIIGTVGLYAVAYPVVFPLIDHLYFALGLLPIVLAGALAGLRPALYTVIGISVLHFALLAGVLGRSIRSAIIASVPVVTLLIGATVGYLRDVRVKVGQQREELEQKNERLENIAGVLSHDLRNPLNVAMGQLDLSQEEPDADHLEAAIRSLERMDVLIDDMLALARAGEAIGETEPVALPSLVDACWHNVESETADLVCETDLTVQADRTRTQQLLENLFRNAVEHGGADVTITVGGKPNGFYVEDDGPGIPEAHRDEVFDPGVSLASDGTGYGLSIVQEIADAHGWDVTATDGANGGARFEFHGVQIDD